MTSQDIEIEQIALEIALSKYGGYYVSREEREKWPAWQECLASARAQIESRGKLE